MRILTVTFARSPKKAEGESRTLPHLKAARVRMPRRDSGSSALGRGRLIPVVASEVTMTT